MRKILCEYNILKMKFMVRLRFIYIFDHGVGNQRLIAVKDRKLHLFI